jgi:thioredoxin reductase (NADPH)
MANLIKTKVLVIGSGPAGYSAAVYAARASLDPVLVAGFVPGGQLTMTTDVENYPGFAEAVQGPWLMEQMRAQAAHVGTKIIEDEIVSVNLSARPFKAKGTDGTEYEAQTLVIATGAQAKWLGLESEQFYQGFGVSGCATCDGFFFRGKEVMVVGGGNTAVEEALYLTNHASKVTILHRRDSLRAEKILQQRLFAHPNVSVIWDSVVEEVLGQQKPKSVTGAKIRNLKTNEVREVKTDGVFIAIGHTPNTSLFAEMIELDAEGYIITKPDSTETNVPGVFACGDVQDKVFRQAITAAGTGCMAALQANKFLIEYE